MIFTLLRIARLSLRRDRVAQMMIFVLPVSFFSIFALVFGGQNMRATPHVDVLVVDEDRTVMSSALVSALRQDASLRVRDSMSASDAAGAARVPLDRAGAELRVRRGDAPVAVVLPAGWGAAFPDFEQRGPEVQVLADPADPVARQMITGLLQQAGARAMIDAQGQGTTRTGEPRQAVIVRTHTDDVLGDRKRGGAMVSFYAAGIAVMFLLFSASSGGGALLDEQESGTLERVLGTRVGMTGLLAGKWLHLVIVGTMQVTVMFVARSCSICRSCATSRGSQ
jgi:ABC-2 type transport system permease protein